MRKLKVLLSVCLLSASMPTSVWATVNLDADNNGVDIKDIVRVIQDSQAASEITGKTSFDKSDIRGLLEQVSPVRVTVPKFGTIYGVVRDEMGAVGDAWVTLGDSKIRVQTDEFGKFMLANVPVTYGLKIKVTKSEYIDLYSEPFNIFAGNVRTLDTLILSKIPTYGSVSGYVYGPDNQLIAGAAVTVDGGSAVLASTNGSGYFSIPQLRTGLHDVTVTSGTYEPVTQTIDVKAGNTVITSYKLDQGSQPVITGSVKGVVKDVDGIYLPDAQATITTVTGSTYWINSNSSGQFVINGIPTGIVDLTIAAAGYVDRHFNGITVTANEYDAGTITLARQVGGIAGQVVNGFNQPIAHALVSAATANNVIASVETGNDGRFLFSGIPTGLVELKISANGYETMTLGGVTVSGGSTSLGKTIALTPIAEAQEGRVTGLVRDFRESDMSGASVTIKDLQSSYEQTVQVDSDGNFLFEHVPASESASYTIFMQQAGYYMLPIDSFSVYAGQTVEHNLTLIPDVGSNEADLNAALEKYEFTIKVNSFGGYTGIIHRAIEQRYYLSDGLEGLTAFVNNGEGFMQALQNENVSKIYVTNNLRVVKNFEFFDRPIQIVSNSGKVIAFDHYLETNHFMTENVVLSQPPMLGEIYISNENMLIVSADKNANLYLVPALTEGQYDFKMILWNAVRTASAQGGEQTSMDISNLAEGQYMVYAIDGLNRISQPSNVIYIPTSQYPSVPDWAHSGWKGIPIAQGLGTKQVALNFEVKDAEGRPLTSYTASDFSVRVNGMFISLSNSDVFSGFYYNDESKTYNVIFKGTDHAAEYTLSELSVMGTPIQAAPLQITTPGAGTPIQSIKLSLNENTTRIEANGSFGLRIIIQPDSATNKDIVWSLAPTNIATISEGGYVNTKGLGPIAITATNPLSGVSQTLYLTVVDKQVALSKVQSYAASGGNAPLTLEDLKDTCVGNIVDSAFDNYKRALIAQGAAFQYASSFEVDTLIRSIIKDLTALLNQALYD
ncbi:carboxypeptidase-like regulatory domain-containing protein [Paenibacillus sp. N3.4]|uniref:carboxypeptidase-like regulatory domain-containing protein n=1 Tax=Paenibacillus sp. N3.4 TaxID=2603222 RepID=UPI0016503A0D|nr:carboxypeptidase-like regulatory domain-containing protein [Paenibacillus sp. N3.4]